MLKIKSDFEKLILEELAIADSEPKIIPDKQKEIREMYADFDNSVHQPTKIEARELRFVDAIAEALDIAMSQHPNLVLMGQDIAEYGGVFKITDGLLSKYGAERVRNTPLCEAAILGSALGLSISGYKSMVEMQFSDFVTEGFNQIVNNLAKSHYRWNQNSDVVVRMPTGAGVAAGPYHSQSTEAWFTHVPGLKVVYPSTPEDAKGLLLQSFEDPNPIMFFEHKKLYRTLKSNVPEGFYTIPFGKARFHQKGDEISIITYGLGVHWAKEVLANHPEIKADLIDLRTLVPWDRDAVIESVRKTGKALVLHEDIEIGGFGGEISAVISEECFEDLDAPVLRVGAMNTAVPFDASLENQFLPLNEFQEKLIQLWKY